MKKLSCLKYMSIALVSAIFVTGGPVVNSADAAMKSLTSGGIIAKSPLVSVEAAAGQKSCYEYMEGSTEVGKSCTDNTGKVIKCTPSSNPNGTKCVACLDGDGDGKRHYQWVPCVNSHVVGSASLINLDLN